MDCKKLRSQVDEVNSQLTAKDLERLAWKAKVAALDVQLWEACEDIGWEIEERFEALEKVGFMPTALFLCTSILFDRHLPF